MSKRHSLYRLSVLFYGVLFSVPVYGQTADTDSDAVPDAMDNCVLVANQNQIDTDGDGWGNACDPDFNNDGIVNFLDLAEFGSAFLSADTLFDMNGDGAVNFIDFVLVTQFFHAPPGPAGFAIWQTGGFSPWDDPMSWFPAAVPTSLTHVVIEQDVTFVLIDPVEFEIKSLELTGARLTIVSHSNEKLIILGTLVADSGVIIENGEMAVNGSVDSSGAVVIQGGVLTIGGDFNTSEDVSIAAGTLSVFGSLALTGSAQLAIDGFDESCRLENARLFKSFGQEALTFSNPFGALCVFSNVTVAAKATVSDNAALIIEGDLTLDDGDLVMESGDVGSELIFPNSHSILGSGEIPFVTGGFGEGRPRVMQGNSGSPSLTIGPDIVIGVSTSGGSIGSPAGDIVLHGTGVPGFSGNPLVFSSGSTVLHGAVRGGGNSGGAVRFDGDLTTLPNSILSIAGAGELLGEQFVHQGELLLNNAELTLGPVTGGQWSGDGEILPGFLDDSVITLYLDVMSSDIRYSGGTVREFVVHGKIDNNGGELIGSSLANYVMLAEGGRIQGGFVEATDSNDQSWHVSSLQSTFVLDDVFLTGTLHVEAGATLGIENNLQLGGELVFEEGDGAATVELMGTQTLTGDSSALLVFENSQQDASLNWLKPVGAGTAITIDGELTLIGSNTSARIGDAGTDLVLNAELTRVGLNSSTEILASAMTLNNTLILGTGVDMTIDAQNASFGFDASLGITLQTGDASSLSFVNEPMVQGSVNLSLAFGYTPIECDEFSFMTFPSVQYIGPLFLTGEPLPNGLTYGLIDSPGSLGVRLVGPTCPL